MNKDFEDRIVAARGEEGKKVLDTIPQLIRKYEGTWGLEVLDSFALSYNYVAPAILTDGTHVVFKIGLHGHDEFRPEHDALMIFNGDGIAKLLRSNLDDDVLLLEAVEPGDRLSLVTDDDEATRIVASIIKKLHKSVPTDVSFPSLHDWFDGFNRLKKKFNGTSGPMPRRIVQEGEELFRYLLNSSTEQVLLHGDLHHDNILSSHREGWLAIDPDAVIGERAHETAAMLRNPQEKVQNTSNLSELLSRRIAILSEELGLDKERIKQWGVAQNVLSAIWKIEDEGKDWNNSLMIAETLSSLTI